MKARKATLDGDRDLAAWQDKAIDGWPTSVIHWLGLLTSDDLRQRPDQTCLRFQPVYFDENPDPVVTSDNAKVRWGSPPAPASIAILETCVAIAVGPSHASRTLIIDNDEIVAARPIRIGGLAGRDPGVQYEATGIDTATSAHTVAFSRLHSLKDRATILDQLQPAHLR